MMRRSKEAMMGVWTVEKDGRVAILRMDKPPLNLIHLDDILELGEKVMEAREDPEVRAIVLTGTGKSFIGGADVSNFEQLGDAITAKYVLQAGQRVLRDMEEMEKPVIAAINGYTFGGGCEVALACDIRICNEYAKFGQLEINYGVMPGWAGSQRLTKIVGLGRAKDLVLTGRIIDAQEAHGRGDGRGEAARGKGAHRHRPGQGSSERVGRVVDTGGRRAGGHGLRDNVRHRGQHRRLQGVPREAGAGLQRKIECATGV
jgi:1,4-dihydroxy-2-naphthoyl-CoA synthase